MKIHFVDSQGVLHLRPFIYSLRQGSFEQYEEDRTETIALQFFTSGAEYRLFALFPCHWHLFGVNRSRLFLLGSDAYGRDLFSRILYGGQISVLAGLLAATLALFFGLFLGAIAGYYGGWRDHLLMRFAELFLALPWLYLLFALRAFLPLALSPFAAFFLIVTVIGTVGWARPARLVRGIVLSVKERDFVRAARGFGASDTHILRRHILPQTTSVILTQAALLVPQFILAEVTLSFVGLGVPEPASSWGNLLANLQQYSVLVSYWWMYLPAAAMVPFFLGYLGLASSLQDYAATAKIDREAGRSRT
jgi:peptide/nickel transport system permease protein